MSNTALDLIDKLIECFNDYGWEPNKDYYLNDLIPRMIQAEGMNVDDLEDDESNIVKELRLLLSQEEWADLRAIISQRQAETLKELQSDVHRHQQVQLAKAQKDETIAKLRESFKSDFLSTDNAFQSNTNKTLLSTDEYQKIKSKFVQEWATRELSLSLDSDQAAAVAAVKGNVKIVARAGSGKTRTLVTRAIFLQKHCHVSPREILLLAFNKKAAEEMKARLTEFLGDDLPHVMTFHALAHAVVPPRETREELLFDDESTDNFELSLGVQDIIDRLISSENYMESIKKFIIAHNKADWLTIEAGRFNRPMEEFLDYRRALPRQSLNGDPVDSLGEKLIANALFENSIEYKYKRDYHSKNGKNYKPQFMIKNGNGNGIILEYYGSDEDKSLSRDDYNDRLLFWTKEKKWAYLFYSSDQLKKVGGNAFQRKIIQYLKNKEITCRQRSEDEIWKIIRKRALDSFTNLVKNFIGRCRKKNLTINRLDDEIFRHIPITKLEELFLELGRDIYRDYLGQLLKTKKEDFDGLMWRAINSVRGGKYGFVRDKNKEKGDLSRLSFILVDEYQDFTPVFYELVKSIQSLNSKVSLFCVGDDWQAINGFAGSVLDYFNNFEKYFSNCSTFYIPTNYRSAKSIVELGNALMYGLGEKAKPKENTELGWTKKLYFNKFKPHFLEKSEFKPNDITPAVLRLIKKFLDEKKDIVLLSRRNNLPWSYNDTHDSKPSLVRFEKHIRSYLPEPDRVLVKVSTTHKYKGLESASVIIMDAIDGCYPLIHSDWCYLRIFGDTPKQIEEEERRLFYVALTRSKGSLAIITESDRISPFLTQIEEFLDIPELSWDKFPHMPSLQGPRLVISVNGDDAYKVTKELKKDQFIFNGQFWSKPIHEKGFDLETIKAKPWTQEGKVKFQIRTEQGDLIYPEAGKEKSM